MPAASKQTHARAGGLSLAAKTRIWWIAVVLLIALGIWQASSFRWAALLPGSGLLMKGLMMSVFLSITSTIIGALIAIPLAVARVYGPWGIRHVATAFIEVVRATPELMVIFWVFFGIPAITGVPIGGWSAALFALVIIAAAYLAEVFRAGFYSVDSGQWEAGCSTGLKNQDVFFRIILPQAVTNMIPAFLGQIVMLFKTTSLVYIVGIIEFFRAAQIISSTVYAPYATYTLVAVGYFVICGAASLFLRRFGRAELQ